LLNGDIQRLNYDLGDRYPLTLKIKEDIKLKKDPSGAVVKHKARLVAKGYAQRAGVDFDEVFVPVARLNSVRLLLAQAAQEGWMAHHMDVRSAFLNGELKEEVYVCQPPGFEKEKEANRVYKVDKALYGLGILRWTAH
jgi:hypothetical protein